MRPYNPEYLARDIARAIVLSCLGTRPELWDTRLKYMDYCLESGTSLQFCRDYYEHGYRPWLGPPDYPYLGG